MLPRKMKIVMFVKNSSLAAWPLPRASDVVALGIADLQSWNQSVCVPASAHTMCAYLDGAVEL